MEDHWQFDDFVGSHCENGGLVKMTLNANFIITNEFLISKYSYISIFIEIGDH
jgi:hypothetical protein